VKEELPSWVSPCRSVHSDRRAQGGITLAWQEPARYEGLQVRTFITAGSKDKSTENVRRALELVGLDPNEYIEKAVDRTLSGGERKRIELASILTMEPKLVMMDEPDSGIDMEALNGIFDAIQFLKKKGTTVLLIMHSLAVLKQADHAFLVCCGKILDKGSADKIMSFRISGRGNDRIRIHEKAHLAGEGARGVLTTNIAVRERAQAQIKNTMIASAPFARGHVDCKEIVQGNAIASAIPIVEVRHPKAHVTHEASIGSVDSKQLETLMARGLTEDEATGLIIEGLLSPSYQIDY